MVLVERRHQVEKSKIIQEKTDKVFRPYIKYLCYPGCNEKKLIILCAFIFIIINRITETCLREIRAKEIGEKDKNALNGSIFD